MKKPLNITGSLRYKISITLLGLLLLGNAIALTHQVFSVTANEEYFVAHEDEVIYYGSAKLFAETGSLQAESCINEDVSPIGKINWYGPGYNVVYGSLVKVFGNTNSLFIKFHLALVLMALLIVLVLQGNMESNLLAANIFLMTEQFTSYIFSYFPETLHLFFSAILIFVLFLIYKENQPANKRTPLVILYVALIVLFSLCRVTTIFWLAGLLPLGNTWRQRVPFIAVFAVGIVCSLVYLRYCIAPPYAGEMHKLRSLYSFSLWDFIAQSVIAVLRNLVELTKINSKPIYLMMASGAMVAYGYWKLKDRFLLAALLISICLVGVLMAYYSVSPFFFVKQTAMLLPLLIVAVMRSPHLWIKYFLFVLFIFYWVPVNKARTENINEHKAAYVNLSNNRAMEIEFEKIRSALEPYKDHVILWCYNEFDYGNALQALLPYSSSTGNPIMYTTNIVDPSTASMEEKFKLHNKLRVEYVLSRKQIEWPTMKEVFHTPFYYFYRINRESPK
jgi:hypothetical protein